MKRRDLDAEATAWISGFTTDLLEPERLAAFGERLDAAIAADLPAVTEDAALRQDLRTSTQHALRGYFRRMPTDDPRDIPIPPASRDLFRALAQRGNAVSELLRIFPAGQRAAWQTVMDAAFAPDTDPALRQPVLNRLWEHVNRVTGVWAEQAVEAYLEEVQQRMHGALARRVDTVHAILRGDGVDIEAATRRLGHNLHGKQAGLVLWAPDAPEDADAIAALESFAGAIAAAAGTARPLTVPAGPRTIWAWLVLRSDTDLRAALCMAGTRHPGLRAGIGIAAPGLDGFRTGHTEAVQAQSIAMDTGSASQATFYRDVELLSCLAADPVAMRAMVARELGGLAGTDSTTQRLRETVLVYLEHSSSIRAAQALGVHKNTVLYRLSQAEQILGHPLDERRLNLEVALRLDAAYGERLRR